MKRIAIENGEETEEVAWVIDHRVIEEHQHMIQAIEDETERERTRESFASDPYGNRPR